MRNLLGQTGVPFIDWWVDMVEFMHGSVGNWFNQLLAWFLSGLGWLVTNFGEGVWIMLGTVANSGAGALAAQIDLLFTRIGVQFPNATTMLNSFRNWCTGTGPLQGNEIFGAAGYIASIFVDNALVIGASGIWVATLLVAFTLRFCIWGYHQFWGSN